MKQLGRAIEQISRRNFEQEVAKRKKTLQEKFDSFKQKRIFSLDKLGALITLMSSLIKWISIRSSNCQPPTTVWFNAWRHDKAEALWAAFALEFLRQISQFRLRYILRILIGNIKLFLLRFDWKNGFQKISLVLLGLLIMICIGILALRQGDSLIQEFTKLLTENREHRTILQWIVKLTVTGTSVIGFISFLLQLLNIGNPKNDLAKYLRSPNYQNQVSFIETFHEDFKKIVEAFTGRNKVYVFIDDLDRCEISKSAELMQAINMMISNEPQLIFILGMDRDKVAAGLAVKYKPLIPYLEQDAPENKIKRSLSAKGMDYAYTFMEKFIQLPFQVPQPSVEMFKSFLEQTSHSQTPETVQLQNIQKTNKNSQSQNNQQNQTLGSSEVQKSKVIEEREQREQRIERVRIKLGETNDTQTIREIALMIASALDYNPRRVKQLINLFRLKVCIAASLGLFDDVSTNNKNTEGLTLEQLGKFTAIILRWPRLLVDLQADHQLLAKLQSLALSVPPDFSVCDSTTKFWGNNGKLVELLRYPEKQESSSNKIALDNTYSLEKIDIIKLLQVSPRVTRPLQTERNVDYTRLRDLLAAGNWKDADYETYLVMLKVVGRESDDWIRPEELLNFPCTDLLTIDSLWVEYSNRRFGFSVQKKIYLEVGGVPHGEYHEEAFDKFGDRVGWKVKGSWISYTEVTFDTKAPVGHLPVYVLYCDFGYFRYLVYMKVLSRYLLSHPDL